MSDFLNSGSRDDELEQILRQVRAEKSEGTPDIEPEKEWSMADIDRLIAEESGEEYVPEEPKKESAADRLEKMLGSSGYDDSIFTIREDSGDSGYDAADDLTDIFSGSEVDGQEVFFEEDEVMMDALEAGAEDFAPEEGVFEVYTDPDGLSEVAAQLEGKYKFLSAQVEMVPQNYVKLTDEENIKKFEKMLDLMDDNDDIQNVWHNWEDAE